MRSYHTCKECGEAFDWDENHICEKSAASDCWVKKIRELIDEWRMDAAFYRDASKQFFEDGKIYKGKKYREESKNLFKCADEISNLLPNVKADPRLT